MSFILADAFCGYTAIADTADFGWSVVGSPTFTNNIGRFGLGGITSAYVSQFTRGFTAVAAGDKVIMQFSAKWNAGARTLASPFMVLKNNGGVDLCMTLSRTPSDAVQVLDASGSIAGTSAGSVLTSGAHHVIVVKAKIGDNATGTVDVYVNNMATPMLALTGVDLNGPGAANGCDFVDFRGAMITDNVTGHNWILSELIVYSSTGAAPWNDVLGDKRLYPLLPTGDSAVAWTRSSGATNADMVDDPLTAEHDGDSTYNSTAAAAVVDEFTLADLPTGVIGIVGVVSNLTARKTDGGAEVGALNHRIKSNATASLVAAGALTTGYVNYQGMYLLDPNGAITWTKTAVDALLAGYSIP